MNNNNNIILEDSLESLRHKEFRLQSSQQRVDFSLSLSWETYKNKGGMKGKKMEEKWIEMYRPELRKWIFLYFSSSTSVGFLRV